jgi:alkanesulfonate monooxygenase SsuD/methylene tetrahydromethanopterin reductase-like flavin-dependent oxidoreductase (luciferase family)
MLRVVAEHADLWNIPGGDIDDVVDRSALLDRYCAEIGRDPASITRSIHLPVSYERPRDTRDAIGEAIDAGFTHVVLGLPAPYPADTARWVADELITTAPRIAGTGSRKSSRRRPQTWSSTSCAGRVERQSPLLRPTPS